MYVIISVDGSVYTGKSSNKISAKEAAEKTYGMLANSQSPSMLVHLSTGGILILGPEVVARAHIIYYDEEE